MWTSADKQTQSKVMRISRVIAAMAVTICALAAHAQQELMTSQYMFNGLFLNPAYAGSHPYASATVLHRSQWVGMEGAPRTNLLGLDAPLMDGKMGVGVTFSHDVIGISRDMADRLVDEMEGARLTDLAQTLVQLIVVAFTAANMLACVALAVVGDGWQSVLMWAIGLFWLTVTSANLLAIIATTAAVLAFGVAAYALAS